MKLLQVMNYKFEKKLEFGFSYFSSVARNERRYMYTYIPLNPCTVKSYTIEKRNFPVQYFPSYRNIIRFRFIGYILQTSVVYVCTLDIHYIFTYRIYTILLLHSILACIEWDTRIFMASMQNSRS